MFFEFALTVPVFLLLILAVMEFAAVLYVRHSMLFAAQDATRSYAIHEVDSAGAIALAGDRLQTIPLSFSISATPDADFGLDRWVEVSVSLSEASLGDPLNLLGGDLMTVRVTMRGEGN